MKSFQSPPVIQMKIMIPGGHLTPALGLIDWIKEKYPDVELVFVGRKYSQQKLKQPALEFNEISKRHLEFISFEGVKSSRSLLLMPLKLLKLILSVRKALSIVDVHKPDVLMSFGGYMAIPLAIASKIRGVPILTHEGTSVVGRANKILFRLADGVVYSYPKFYNFDLSTLKKPSLRTGTPLRTKIILPNSSDQPIWIKKPIGDDQRILLVLGGSQGSLTINKLIQDSIQELVKDWIVVHQCGRPNKFYNYREELIQRSSELKVSADRYYVREWIEEEELAWLYKVATLAVSRSGANTLEELRYYQIPSILIPLPHSYYQEQEMNANFMAEHGAAIILLQNEATPENLLSQLNLVLTHRKQIQANLKSVPLLDSKQAPELIFQQLKKICKQPSRSE
ncbi:MAG: UDP-N-acetylglucosamine--N-acetylmuramyl-(pentapeptide) pyrophosphoryl-undecaprenol N-acetylglucosamine transferase [Microgenomates bacterium 39_7]|nr:MAG: UDP-N-acetylglucosamine--N-acetylmuramyl-(pentapeptide) pyrophosphoryl-undecaprenol N-acetylglucosamine transferase [Microgenomates bacterium 39_7]